MLEPPQNVSGMLCPVSALARGASEHAWCGRRQQSLGLPRPFHSAVSSHETQLSSSEILL